MTASSLTAWSRSGTLYALVGRTPHAALELDDREVNARHAYLHLDARGVYVVDLATRTGTRINGGHRGAGWLRPGDWLEVAGRKIELQRIRVNGQTSTPRPAMMTRSPTSATIPSPTSPSNRDAATTRPGPSPRNLSSSARRSPAASRSKTSKSRARTSQLFRVADGAFLIDLCGRQTWVEDQLVRGDAPPRRRHDHDRINAVSRPPRTARPRRAASPPNSSPARMPHTRWHARNPPKAAPWLRSRAPVPDAAHRPDPRRSPRRAMAWMVGTIQGGQGEMLRRQVNSNSPSRRFCTDPARQHHGAQRPSPTHRKHRPRTRRAPRNSSAATPAPRLLRPRRRTSPAPPRRVPNPALPKPSNRPTGS